MCSTCLDRSSLVPSIVLFAVLILLAFVLYRIVGNRLNSAELRLETVRSRYRQARKAYLVACQVQGHVADAAADEEEGSAALGAGEAIHDARSAFLRMFISLCIDDSLCG